MRKIAITLPEFFDGEWEAITELLTEGGYERVHIRKPGASVKEVKSLVKTYRRTCIRCSHSMIILILQWR